MEYYVTVTKKKEYRYTKRPKTVKKEFSNTVGYKNQQYFYALAMKTQKWNQENSINKVYFIL